MDKRLIVGVLIGLFLLTSIPLHGVRATGDGGDEEEIVDLEISSFILGNGGNNSSVVLNNVPTVLGGISSVPDSISLNVNITDEDGVIYYEWNATTNSDGRWYQEVTLDIPKGIYYLTGASRYYVNVTYALNDSVYGVAEFFLGYNQSAFQTDFTMTPVTTGMNISFEYQVSDVQWMMFQDGDVNVELSVWTYENYTLADTIVAGSDSYTLDDDGFLSGYVLVDGLLDGESYIVTISMMGYTPDVLIDANGADGGLGIDADRGDSGDCVAGGYMPLFDDFMYGLRFMITGNTLNWMWGDDNQDGAYSVTNDTVESLIVYNCVGGVYDPSPYTLVDEDSIFDFPVDLTRSSNIGAIYFNDTDSDYFYSGDGMGVPPILRRSRLPADTNEDIWMDNGNGKWDIDGDSFTFYKESHVFNYVAPTTEMSLSFGWNLRANSFDIALNTTDFFDLSDNITSISYKDADGIWFSVIREEDDGGNWTTFGDDFDIEPGFGCFIYCNAEDGVDITALYPV